MRRTLGIISALASFSIVLLLLVAGGIFVLFGTETGDRFVTAQTSAALGRLFGPAYEATLGPHEFEFRDDGTLALSWSDVKLQRKDRTDFSSEIGRVSVALRLMPLVGGSLEFGRLEIADARLDLAAFAETASERRRLSSGTATAPAPTIVMNDTPAARSRIARTADSTIRTLERQLQALQAFHFDTVAFSNITVEGFTGAFTRLPDLQLEQADLHRTLDGSLSLYVRAQVGGLPVTLGGAADFDNDSGQLQSLSLRSSRIDLGAVFPPAPMSEVKDERAFGSDAFVSLEAGMHRERDSATAVLSIGAHMTKGQLQLGLNRTGIEESDLRIEYREGEDRLQILKSPLRFSDVAFELAGVLEPATNDGIVNPDRLNFRIGTSELLSRVGRESENAEALSASVWLDGYIDMAERIASIDKLELLSGEGRLTGSAVYRNKNAEDLTSLRLVAKDLTAPSIKAFWPFLISGKARKWVLAHVGDEGLVPNGTIAIDVSRERRNQAFKPGETPNDGELQIDLSLRNMDLSTVGSLPRLRSAEGLLETRGGTTRVFVDRSDIDQHPDLTIGPSTVVLGKPVDGNRRDLQIDLALKADGAVKDALAIANVDPIRALRSAPIDIDKVSGWAETSVTASLRLGDDILPKNELQGWSVESDIRDGELNQPIEGQRLSKLQGKIKAIPGQVSGSFDADVEGIPSDLEFTIPFGQEPVGERRIDVSASVSGTKIAQLVPALKDVVDGQVSAQLSRVGQETRIVLDLTPTSLDLPAIAWKKGVGVRAKSSFVLEREDDGITNLRQIELDGDGFSAKGSVSFDKDGLRSADLKKVALNPGDDVGAKVVRHGKGFGIELKGKQFDARPLLAEVKGGLGRNKDKNDGRGTFDIDADIETLNGFNGRAIRNFLMNYASARGKLAALNLAGTVGAGTVTGDLSPRDALQAVRIRSADTGAFLAFAGLYAHMEGGQATVELLGSAESGYAGTVQIQNFTLVNEPRLSRIVGSSNEQDTRSLSQAVGQELESERAFFDHASARLNYRASSLRVTDGIVRGPVFGSSFNGTLYDPSGRIDISGSFMPAYGINRVFGSIPVLGQLLGNGNEGGLLGITYRLDGPFASPTLIVNPISIIAPGIFRQIFAY